MSWLLEIGGDRERDACCLCLALDDPSPFPVIDTDDAFWSDVLTSAYHGFTDR